MKDFYETRATTTDGREINERSLGRAKLFTIPEITAELKHLSKEFATHFDDFGQAAELAAPEGTKTDLSMLFGAARTWLKVKGVDFEADYRKRHKDGAGAGASPPVELDLSSWPWVQDRGDGEPGCPVDHPWISFTAELLDQYTHVDDLAIERTAAAPRSGGLGAASPRSAAATPSVGGASAAGSLAGASPTGQGSYELGYSLLEGLGLGPAPPG